MCGPAWALVATGAAPGRKAGLLGQDRAQVHSAGSHGACHATFAPLAPPCRKWKHHLQGPCLLETEGPESPRLPKTPVQETWPVCMHILPGPGVTHCALPVVMWGHSSGSGWGQGVPPHQEGCCSGGLGSVLGVKWAGTLHLHSIPFVRQKHVPNHTAPWTRCVQVRLKVWAAWAPQGLSSGAWPAHSCPAHALCGDTPHHHSSTDPQLRSASRTRLGCSCWSLQEDLKPFTSVLGTVWETHSAQASEDDTTEPARPSLGILQGGRPGGGPQLGRSGCDPDPRKVNCGGLQPQV